MFLFCVYHFCIWNLWLNLSSEQPSPPLTTRATTTTNGTHKKHVSRNKILCVIRFVDTHSSSLLCLSFIPNGFGHGDSSEKWWMSSCDTTRIITICADADINFWSNQFAEAVIRYPTYSSFITLSRHSWRKQRSIQCWNHIEPNRLSEKVSIFSAAAKTIKYTVTGWHAVR